MVVYEDAMLSIWRFGKVTCAYWTDECLDVHCEAILKEIQFTQNTGRAYISIIGRKSKPPSTKHRKLMTDALKAGTPTTAIWILADGFQGAVYRSVITMMHTASGNRTKLKVCSTGTDAAAFTANAVGDNPSHLFDQMEAARALVDARLQ